MAAISPLRQRMIEDDGPQSAAAQRSYVSAVAKCSRQARRAELSGPDLRLPDRRRGRRPEPDLVPLNPDGGLKPPSPSSELRGVPRDARGPLPLDNRGCAAGR